MIDGLISGKLYGQPKSLVGKSGKPFVTAKLKTAAGDGVTIFANVIAFDPQVCAALLALGAGDSVAVSGDLTPKVWTDKEGVGRPTLDVTAAGVVTAYHVSRRRRAMLPKPEDRGQPEFGVQGEWDGAQDFSSSHSGGN